MKYNNEACFKKCQGDKQTNFLTIKETLCFRNCFTKTNSCFKMVIDNVENSGATFYREMNEQEAIKNNPELASALRDSRGTAIDAELGIKPSGFNMSLF